jgi:hypothetical protein
MIYCSQYATSWNDSGSIPDRGKSSLSRESERRIGYEGNEGKRERMNRTWNTGTKRKGRTGSPEDGEDWRRKQGWTKRMRKGRI